MYVRTNEITQMMVKSHAKLNMMINRVVDGVNMSQKKRLAMFEDFCEKLNAHFKIEETGIFGFVGGNDQMTKTIRQLYDEHRELNKMVEKIGETIKTGSGDNFEEFLILMAKHTRTENEVLYPFLDLHLEEELRNKIRSEIKDSL